jgi:hypothetical protein
MQSMTTIRRKPIAKSTASTNYEAVENSKTEEDESSLDRPVVIETPDLSGSTIAMLTAIVFGCTLVLLGAVSYLTFLWYGQSMTGWKSIILSNWTATSVAMCALAIRWMSGFQTILCTSILALVLLERGVPLPKIPRISTIRFSSGGPLDIMLCFPTLWKQGFHLSFVCLLTLVASLVLQFSSTLLLSDLATGPIEQFARNTYGVGLATLEHGYGGINVDSQDYDYNIADSFYSDPLLSTTPAYPVFAEYTYPDINKPYDGYPPANNIDDTEPVIRAILPISTQQNRSELLTFDGNATLYDARWVCMPPYLENLTLIGVLSGIANFSVWPPELYEPSYKSFACSVGPTYSSRTSWSLFTCSFYEEYTDNSDLGGIVSALDYKANVSGYWYPDETSRYPPQGIGYTWLVINATNFTLDSGLPAAPNVYNYTFDDHDAWSMKQGDSGPWLSITSSQKHARRAAPICSTSYGCTYDSDSIDPDDESGAEPWSFQLDVAMCTSALTISKNMHVNAWRNQASEEPSTLFEGIRQLNASGSQLNLEERGVMQLNGTEMWRQLAVEKTGEYREWQSSVENIYLTYLRIQFLLLMRTDSVC